MCALVSSTVLRMSSSEFLIRIVGGLHGAEALEDLWRHPMRCFPALPQDVQRYCIGLILTVQILLTVLLCRNHTQY